MKSKKLKLKVIAIILLVAILSIFLVVDHQYQANKAEHLSELSKKEVSEIKKVTDKDGYNLPLITISCDEDIKPDEKIFGKMKVYDNGGNNKLTNKPNIETNISIKERGNTTKLVPKRQYSIDLYKDNNVDKNKEKLLGLPKNSDWILNAPFEDTSLIRNALAYSVIDKIMDYAPSTKFCEVFVDMDHNGITKDDYRGVYVLIEKIKVDDKRVNINETDPEEEETSFIVQKNNQHPGDIALNNYGYKSYLYDYEMIVEYPKKTLTDKQKTYITREVSKFEKAIYDDPSSDEYTHYIDVDSFVDYYIVNEFFNNPDAGILSTYIYKDFGSKIKAGPVWDFNASLGNSNALSPYYDYEGFYMNSRPWFDMLMKNKTFVNKVISRYRELRKTYLSDKYLNTEITKLVDELGPAIQRNQELWPIELCNQFEMFKKYDDVFLKLGQDPQVLIDYMNKHPFYKQSTTNMADSQSEAVKKIRVFIANRGKWMDDNIGELINFTG